MNKEDINALAQEILKHRELYYNGHPAITDEEYDRLYDQLKNIDPDNPAITSIGAPVPDFSEWKKGSHQIPMGSLDKVKNPDELKKWIYDRFNKNNSVFVTEKLDGISIELIYDNGKLVSALTRGDGKEGEDICRNVAKMSGVKSKLFDFTGSLRGEIILKKSKFSKYFPELSNARNAASGIAKRLDGNGCEHLDVLFYQVVGNTEKYELGDFKSEFLQFRFIEDTLKLNTPQYDSYVGSNIGDISAFVVNKWENYHKIRDGLDYDIDGLVVRVNDLIDQEALGEKNLRPNGAVAFKFRGEEAVSSITNILCQVGNSGTITPVAEFNPVNLVGAKISRASLYNFSYIKELGIDIGAEVIIRRGNDVIPVVDDVVKSTGTVFHAPDTCPVCGNKTEFKGERLVCSAIDACGAQILGRVKNWISSLNVLEWGDALIVRLIESGKVKEVSDLYKLSISDIEQMDRMGKKSAKKCYDNLWERNPIPLEIFIGSLSIPMVAASSIKMVIASGINSLDKIISSRKEDFLNVPGLGPVKSLSLYNGLKRNKKVIENLLANGVKIKEKLGGKLLNMSFCFTGEMRNKRKALEELVINNGGEVKSVSKNLTYLVIDDPESTTNKAQTAKKLGIKLISEDQFLSMIK